MNRKQTVSLVLRIVLSVLMLGVLIWRIPSIDLDEVVPELTRAHGAWLFVAAPLTLVAVVLSAVRWQRVLEVLGLHAGLTPPAVVLPGRDSSSPTCCPPRSAATCCA